MNSSDPNDIRARAQFEHLRLLEAIVERDHERHIEAVAALAEISDLQLYRSTHETFDEYLRERWGLTFPSPRPAGSEAFVNLWEQARRAFGVDDVADVELRLTVHKHRRVGEAERLPTGRRAADQEDGALLQLRWLLNQASGTIADAVHRLATGAGDLGHDAREQLSEDILVVEDEITILKALLTGAADWDGEYERLVNGEIPPFADTDDDEGESQ